MRIAAESKDMKVCLFSTTVTAVNNTGLIHSQHFLMRNGKKRCNNLLDPGQALRERALAREGGLGDLEDELAGVELGAVRRQDDGLDLEKR